uniref:EGF-like domain-containing protein n=1 Tax=Tetradesmus obliquus TaxID=3088 RepID=A0A383V938_TETOB|eukprot:jgi/Sobl393_1/3075/SZX61269.1
MLDHLWRWDSMGNGKGDLMLVDLPPPQACSSAPLGSLLPPKECQPGSGISNAASPADSPIYQAVRAYQAGQKGALPLAQKWSALEGSSCEPACQFGTCVKGKCSCWAGYSGPSCSSTTSRPNQCNSLVGINLEGVRDWMHSWAFVDVMKAGRGWLAQGMDGSGGWGNFSGVAADSSGWVGQLGDNMKAGTMMIRDLQGHIPAGTYTILFDGEGVIDCSMDIDVMRQLEAGRIEVDLKPSTGLNNGLFCTLERTNPANPIRNIRVLMPGFDAATAAALPFHPRFVKYLQNYGVLRFMGWMEANTNQVPKTWEQRAKPTDRSYAGVNLGGVPVEHMVLLANMVGAAPWFSMPHLADDAYHRSFAQYVKATLRPDVKVYVEWSNEVWHTGFAGGQYAQAEGVRLGMNEEGAKWYGGATNEARLCYYSERTKAMSMIWKGVFGDQWNRVVVVAQGQAVWPITSDKVLRCRNASSHIDALAVAPYFGSFSASRDTNMATYLSTTLPAQVDAAVVAVAAHADIAGKYGKPLIAYEAGSSIDGSSGFAAQANRDPAMYGLYQRYYTGLVTAGVQLITQFDSMGGPTWGLSEWQDQDPKTAPKLQAVQDFIAANANASSCSGSGSDGSSSSGNSTGPGLPGGSCPNGCSGNGDCLDSKCFCNTGFSGPDCSTTSPTEVYQCGYKCSFDQGVCKPTSLVGSTQYYGCSCAPPFSGLTCNLFSCPGNCSWSGSCLEPGLCACWPGFAGSACEVDCGCNGHGMCTADNSCACDQGYTLGPGGCEADCSGCEAGVGCIAPGECGCAACKYGSCYNGRCECWAGYTGKACNTAAPDTAPNIKSPMGIEVSAPAYYSSQWIWIDAMKQSSAWMTQALPDT